MKNHRYITLFILLFLTLTLLACGGGASGAAPAASNGSNGNAGGQAAPPSAGGQAPGGQAPGGQVGNNAGNGSGAGSAANNLGSGSGGPGGLGGANGNRPAAGVGDVGTLAEGNQPELTGDALALLQNDSAVQVDENGNISVTVTDTQANQMLAGQSAQSTETSQIEDAEVAFTNAGIVFTGSVSGKALYILFWPYVQNGTIQLDVVEATLDGVAVSEDLLDEAETAVNESLSAAMGSMANAITLQSIVVTDGLLTITGSVNG